MKHYNSPVINVLYCGQTDVIRTSSPNEIVYNTNAYDSDGAWSVQLWGGTM